MSPRRADAREIERLDLADLYFPAIGGRRTRDGDVDVGQGDRQAFRPGVRSRRRHGEPLAGRPEPAVAGKLAQSPGSRAIDRGRGIMPGAVKPAARQPAAAISWLMSARVPTCAGDIDAAAEGDRVIDHDDLLMMGGARRMVSVRLKMHPAVEDPFQDEKRRRAAHQGAHQAEAPRQDIDLQTGSPPDDPIDQPAEPVRAGLRRPGRLQLRARVEIPADEIDGMARLQHCRLELGKVIRCIDNLGKAPRPLDAPAG